jgi:hypothetical protein
LKIFNQVNNQDKEQNLQIFVYRALRDVFCFDVLSGNAANILTLTKKARGERVTCYDKLHPGAEGRRIAELLIRTFAPHF